MNSLSQLLTKYQPKEKSKITERGELLTYFLDKLNWKREEKGMKKLTIPAVAVKLTGIPTEDLYYIKSVCDDWEREGKPWGALFWTLLRKN